MYKKGFTASQFVIGMLIFSGVIALFVIAVGSVSNENNANIVNDRFSDTFDRFDNDTARVAEMWDATTSEGGLSLVGTFEVLFFSTFRVVSLVFNGVSEAGRQLFSFGDYFGIPTAVSVIFFTIIFLSLTVVIIFKIISFVKGSGKDL